jgi:hypothetical protein
VKHYQPGATAPTTKATAVSTKCRAFNKFLIWYQIKILFKCFKIACVLNDKNFKYF